MAGWGGRAGQLCGPIWPPQGPKNAGPWVWRGALCCQTGVAELCRTSWSESAACGGRVCMVGAVRLVHKLLAQVPSMPRHSSWFSALLLHANSPVPKACHGARM